MQTGMDAKLRCSWSLKAVQASVMPVAAVPLPALAVLPVLPTSFSSASAELGRQVEAARQGGTAGTAAPGPGATAEAGPILPIFGRAEVPPGSDGPTHAPVRVSEFAAQSTQEERDGPSCRIGDAAGAGAGARREGSDAGEPDRNDPNHLPEMPLPHCRIDVDPDGEEGDVIAHAPGAAKTGQTAGVAIQAPVAVASSQAATQAARDAPASTQATDAPSVTAAKPDAATQAAAFAPVPARDAPLVITSAAQGLGAAVIDPLLPVETVTFASDASFASDALPPLPPAPPSRAAALSGGAGAGESAIDPLLIDPLLLAEALRFGSGDPVAVAPEPAPPTHEPPALAFAPLPDPDLTPFG